MESPDIPAPALPPSPLLIQQSIPSSDLNVIICSYLSKQAHSTLRWKNRFVVLTSRALHWFKRYPSDSLFGVELGSVAVSAIKRANKVKNVLNDGFHYFEVEAVEEGIMGDTDFVRSFRCDTKRKAKDWVSSIEAAMRGKGSSRARSSQNDSKLCQVVSIFPILLSRNERISPFHDEKNVVIGKAGSLPVSFGWDSKPIDLWGDTGITLWRLQLSNGQSITLTRKFLKEAAKEIAVEIQADTAPKSFTQSVIAANLTGVSSLGNATICIKDKKLPTNSSSNRAIFMLCNFAIIGTLISLSFAKFQTEVERGTGGAGLAKEKGEDSGLLTSYVEEYLSSGEQASPTTTKTGPVFYHSLLIGILLATSASFSMGDHSFEVTIVKLGRDPAEHMDDNSDEEEEEEEEEKLKIPIRFIRGTVDQGGIMEAERRWRITKEWRAREKIDSILHRKFPEFWTVKKNYPLFYHGTTKKVFDDGKGGKTRHMTYFEIPGHCNFDKLTEVGVGPVKHFLKFYVEFCYTYLAPFEESKVFNVVDASNFKLTELKGSKLEVFKFVSSLAQDHYPERASVIAVINAPSWFSMFFRMIKPLINETTQKKIRVYTAKETLAGLQEFLDLDRIPEVYGGTCKFYGKGGKPTPPWCGSEPELAMKDFVERLDSGRPLPRPPHFKREDVVETFEDLKGMWEWDEEDPLSWSDIHLPLDEQKSHWAMETRGLKKREGREEDRATVSTPEGALRPIATRPYSESANSSDTEGSRRGWEDRRANSNDIEGSGIKRRDSTLALNSGSDSEDCDSDSEFGRVANNRAASTASDTTSFFYDPSAPRIVEVIHEGWIYKKATGEGWLGRRNWAPRWAKLVEADMPDADGRIGEKNILLLVMFWYESSTAPSSWVFMENCVTVPLDRQAEDWNSHCFDCVHLPAVRQTRSFSALSAHHRDEWVSVINKKLSDKQEEKKTRGQKGCEN